MTVKTTIFNPASKDDNAFLLAGNMPVGRVWESSFDVNSNLGLLIRGLAVEYYRLQILANVISTEMDIDQANQLLLEWEKSVGIPDACFGSGSTTEERRTFIREKFSNFGGVQTKEDFIRVATIFGLTVVSFETGKEISAFPMTFPYSFHGDEKHASHTIIIGMQENKNVFPLLFPIQFTSSISGILECVFRVLAPAPVQLIFVYNQ